MKEKIILTGSEGFLGKNIYDELSKDYIIEKVDLKLGHDLTNEKEVEKIFKDLGPSYGLINLFSIKYFLNFTADLLYRYELGIIHTITPLSESNEIHFKIKI